MGNRIRAHWMFLLVPLLLATPVAAEGALEAHHREGAPALAEGWDDAYWADTRTYTLEADGELDATETREVLVRVAHNGTHLFVALAWTPENHTHEGDFVRLAFDPLGDGDASGSLDLMRHGDGSLQDATWDGTDWMTDLAKGCAVHGAAERAESGGTWQWVLERPLVGDACDFTADAGDLLGWHIGLRENVPFLHDDGNQYGDTFRWPRGSESAGDGRASWGTLRLLSPGEAASSEDGDGDDPASGPDGAGDDADPTADPSDPAAADRSRADGDDADDGTTELPAPGGLLFIVLLAVLARHGRPSR